MGFNYHIYNIYREIEELSDNITDINDLKKLYKFVKENSSKFYLDGNIINSYKIVKKSIRKSEEFFDDYLIDTTFHLNNINITKDSNEKEILDYIVNETRKHMLSSKKYPIDYDRYYEVDFMNWCEKASMFVSHLCDILNVENKIIEIQPGFSIINLLFNGCGFHFFNIVKFDEKRFLVDVTYNQFFRVRDCLIDRIGIMDYSTPKLGAFIDTNNVSKFIKDILYNGYTVIDEDIFKSYLDLFTVSFRNGLYYEKTNDFSYKTNYTFDDYISFLDGDDSQVKQEGREVLGYQKRPLKEFYEYKRNY